jgi:hypothetical protein
MHACCIFSIGASVFDVGVDFWVPKATIEQPSARLASTRGLEEAQAKDTLIFASLGCPLPVLQFIVLL